MSAAKRHSLFALLIGIVLAGCLETAGAEAAPGYQWLNRSTGLPTLQSGVNTIALSKDGAPFVTGFFLGTLTLGSTTLVSASTNLSIYHDLFVARSDENGLYQWARQISGLFLNGSASLAVDSQDRPVLCGTFMGTISLGGTELTGGGTTSDWEIFLAKYSAVGDLLWAKSVGKLVAFVPPQRQPLVALDPAGNIYLTGHFGGTFGGALQIGSFNLPNSGSQDVFLAKFDPDGNSLWARSAGGVALNFSRGIAVDDTGHPFIAGSFSGRMDIGGTNLVSSGGDDLFLARFDGNGDLLWARQGGGSGQDQATAIAVDASGNALIAGEFTGSFASRVATFGDLSLTLSGEGAGDDFVVKYDPSGNALWANQIAGGLDQLPTALAIDSQGNSYVLGSLNGAVAIFGVATLFSPYPNYYVAKFRNDGSAIWAFQGDQARGFFADGLTATVNASGNAYVGGRLFADLFWGKLAADADHSPPTILRQPTASLLVHAGGSATFSVLVSGAQPTSHQWRFNEKDITGATNSSFTLTNATSDPAGSFSVVVSNTFGITTSSNGTVLLATPTTLPDFVRAQSGGGYGWDAATGVAVDEAGAVYVTGFYELWADFSGTWFAVRGGSGGHSRDMFIAKYDGTGLPLWIRDAGSDLEDEGRGVAVDQSGNVYVTGLASALYFGATFQIGNTTLTNTDRFAAKFDSNGKLLWAIPAGGSGVAVDDSGNLYLAGDVSSPPLVIGATTLTNRGAFLARYDADANLLWARQFTGTYLGLGRMLTPSGSNTVYLTGAFEATAVFDGATLTNPSPGKAYFLAKFSSSGDLSWVRQADSAFTHNGAQVAAEPDGGCYWAGAFSSNLVVAGVSASSLGPVNTFVARLTAGGDLQWLQHVKGTNIVLGRTLCVDRFGNILLAGEFAGNILTAGEDGPALASFGSPSIIDAFLAWYDREGKFRGARQIAGPALEDGLSLAAGASGQIYLAGQFGDYRGVEDLSFGPAALASHGSLDYYIAELGALPPVLSLARSSGQLMVSWPTGATNFVLQGTDSLEPPRWNVVTNESTLAGSLRLLQISISDRQEFYRLSEH